MSNDKNRLIVLRGLQNKIYTIRGVYVMLDRDLADLYQVKTIRLSADEVNCLQSHIQIQNIKTGMMQELLTRKKRLI
jgi:ORF6N domain-containing protein